jgi:hypothetical protein
MVSQTELVECSIRIANFVKNQKWNALAYIIDESIKKEDLQIVLVMLRGSFGAREKIPNYQKLVRRAMAKYPDKSKAFNGLYKLTPQEQKKRNALQSSNQPSNRGSNVQSL